MLIQSPAPCLHTLLGWVGDIKTKYPTRRTAQWPKGP